MEEKIGREALGGVALATLTSPQVRSSVTSNEKKCTIIVRLGSLMVLLYRHKGWLVFQRLRAIA